MTHAKLKWWNKQSVDVIYKTGKVIRKRIKYIQKFTTIRCFVREFIMVFLP